MSRAQLILLPCSHPRSAPTTPHIRSSGAATASRRRYTLLQYLSSGLQSRAESMALLRERKQKSTAFAIPVLVDHTGLYEEKVIARPESDSVYPPPLLFSLSLNAMPFTTFAKSDSTKAELQATEIPRLTSRWLPVGNNHPHIYFFPSPLLLPILACCLARAAVRDTS